jgi:hypothetical protein
MQYFTLPLVIIVGLTSILLISIVDWRIRIALLAIQYFGVFMLISLSWPVSMAVSKLIAGWMAGAVLGMAMVSRPLATPGSNGQIVTLNRLMTIPKHFKIPPSSYFYLLAGVLVALLTFSIATPVKSWIPGLTDEQAWAGLLLIGMGVLQLGFRTDPFSTILGLLTISSGVELLYAVVERSTLVAGLLAAITLGLALAGAYLILSPQLEDDE